MEDENNAETDSSNTLANDNNSVSNESSVNDAGTNASGSVAPEIKPGETVAVKLLDFPKRGMTMRQVMNKLGKPNKASMGIGKPPIRHWKYDDRIIYFENTTVVHVVATP